MTEGTESRAPEAWGPAESDCHLATAQCGDRSQGKPGDGKEK